ARLEGTFLHQLDGAELWLVFTPRGRFSNHPPADVQPDWAAHTAEGHRVGTYRLDGDQLSIAWPGGRETTSTVARDTYALTVDGEECRRADYDLTGMGLDGAYRERGGDQTWVFRPDGTVDTPDGPGRYALGAAAIRVKTAAYNRVHTLFSDLLPHPAQPALLLIAGKPLDRLPDHDQESS
ncbi:MAG: hypothetical protein ACI8PZ_007028, partial [Myxococcota bacterium]